METPQEHRMGNSRDRIGVLQILDLDLSPTKDDAVQVLVQVGQTGDGRSVEIQVNGEKPVSHEYEQVRTGDEPVRQGYEPVTGNHGVLERVPETEKKHAEAIDELSLPRNLSSPDRAVRERALTVLGQWLSSCKQVDEGQLVTVWKSLLFRVWHTSKGPAQVELSKSIALTLGSLTPDLALLTFRVFLSIMAKEWSGIDKNRIEKFRLLLQLCLREMFRLLESQRWSEELTRKFVEAIGAQGVNVFLVHAYLEELRSFVPPTAETLRVLLEPFVLLSVNCSNKVVLQKVRDTVFLPLLQEARAALRSEAGEGKSLGSLVLALSMAGKFSELSASPSVAPSNKKLLQQLYEDFSNSEKPLLALRPLTTAKSRAAAAAVPPAASEVPPAAGEMQQQEVSVTGRKRKRVLVNAGEAVVEQRRVLRSEKRLLDEVQQAEEREWDPEGDPVVLNLEEKLTRVGSPRSEDDSRHDALSSSKEESEGEQQQKRVRFSLRSNIVWTPDRPLPPQWVRVPPCAAPRGSAMKAGVEPGPIRTPSPGKSKDEEKSVKKRKSKKGKRSGGSKQRGKGAAAAAAAATPPRKSKRINKSR